MNIQTARFQSYLYRYAREGILRTERAANAREECRKIKSVARMAAQVRLLRQILIIM